MNKTTTSQTISAEAGLELLSAAVRAADAVAIAMSIAVVDTAGSLRHFHRMEGASLLTAQLAIDKAYTAAAGTVPSSAWYGMIADDPSLLNGMVHTPRLTIVGGGLPILLDGALVGAIGLSGGHYTQDEAAARAALTELGFE